VNEIIDELRDTKVLLSNDQIGKNIGFDTFFYRMISMRDGGIRLNKLPSSGVNDFLNDSYTDARKSYALQKLDMILANHGVMMDGDSLTTAFIFLTNQKKRRTSLV